jgi:hypothetical protein
MVTPGLFVIKPSKVSFVLALKIIANQNTVSIIYSGLIGRFWSMIIKIVLKSFRTVRSDQIFFFLFGDFVFHWYYHVSPDFAFLVLPSNIIILSRSSYTLNLILENNLKQRRRKDITFGFYSTKFEYQLNNLHNEYHKYSQVHCINY